MGRGAMRGSLTLALSFVAGAVACGEGGRGEGGAYQASAGCRLRSPAAWQAFLDEASEHPEWVRTCSDQDDCGELVGDFAERARTEIGDVFTECAEDVLAQPRIAACTERLRAFLPAWQAQHAADSYGFKPGNADYFAAQVGTSEPVGMMAPPEALLAALPNYADLEAAAREQGWPYLVHDSCLGGLRLFVNVQGGDPRFEQWLLFGVEPGAPSVASGSIVSFLAVQKAARDGAPLAQPRVHFRDYFALQNGASWSLSLPETHGGKCYSCHGSGVRQLLPFVSDQARAEPVRGELGYGASDAPEGFAAERLAGMNERLASYGLPDWGDALELGAHGPALGAELHCTSCHDGVLRGPLTVFTSEGMLQRKVVTELSMRSFGGTTPVPDEAAMLLLDAEQHSAEDLSAEDRRALDAARALHEADYQALASSRLPALQAWLREKTCD